MAAYNNTVHSSTGMKPFDVYRKNASQLFDYMELKRKRVVRNMKNKFFLGDLVRVPLNAEGAVNFTKGSAPNWSSELFQVTRIEFGTHVPTYYLCDLEGKPLARQYYTNELNLVASFAELD